MKARCDHCKKEFEVTTTSRHTFVHATEGQVERTYFCCSKCGKQFTICYKNHAVFRLEKERQKLMGEKAAPQTQRRIDRREQQIQAELNTEMIRLKTVIS
ncbi:hypothetical protein HCG80_07035 [Enterococcus casseliflavus]|uniref:hypothetical protein n=1 Tax=Enterococcus casseliflavus TaxID=37734 RepID=UPI001C8CAED7|nr:hypothetical protein [Enterococcus casseliflavus]MBX9126345.1 hypothetical protein [Enterococcus casseliflavus]